MRVVRKSPTAVIVLAAGLALAPLGQVRGQDQAPAEPRQDTPGDIAREGLEQMMRALRLLVESIPQYELPEVLENGDIIIRRKHPKKTPEEPEFDETAT